MPWSINTSIAHGVRRVTDQVVPSRQHVVEGPEPVDVVPGEAAGLDPLEHAAEIEIALAWDEVFFEAVTKAIGEAHFAHTAKIECIDESVDPIGNQMRMIRGE